MRVQQWRTWRHVWLLLLCIALASGMSSAAPTMPIGTCKVVSPIATTSAPAFPCQTAAFGGYIHPGTTQYRVAVAWGDAQLACEPFEEEGDERVYHNAIVVVQRGRCSFQEKWHNVAHAGGSGMLLVNSEDTLLQLGGIAYDGSSDTMALSIAKPDAESLLESLHAHSQQRDDDTTYLSITLPMSRLEQVAARIQYLLQTNMPLIAYEYFMDELAVSSSPMILRDFDALLATLTQHAERSMWIAKIDNITSWFVFFKLCALLFPSQYEFASTAGLHASVAAVSLLLQAPHVTKGNKHNELWTHAAKKLVDAGYYNQSAFCLSQIAEEQLSEYECQLAFIQFVQGNLIESIPISRGCVDNGFGPNLSVSEGLHVAHETLLRVAGMKMSSDDLRCLHQAATGKLSDEDGLNVSNESLQCCWRHRPVPSISKSHDESQALQQRRARHGNLFLSPFVKELFEALNVMGVFLDELGAFNESLIFFQQAAQLCPYDVTLQLRQVLAVPVVFASNDEITRFYSQLKSNIHTLMVEDQRTCVAEEGAFNIRPEHAAYLQYTITPPTMFIGYQGIDVLPVQRAIHALRTTVYPSLQPQPAAWETDSLPPSQEATGRRRIAFVSTWFRNHSVGKLLLGVIEHLDRTKFHIEIYRCVHFLRLPDEITDAFRRVADTYTELPVDMDDALALLRREHIDVLIYPELGMDEWTLLLAHHRIAPVQCVFWGHPITTGNPAIDYFISSEYFVSDFFDSDGNPGNDKNDSIDKKDSADMFMHHGTHFSEQVVLFRGLGTFFTQTLMKLHPSFDDVLLGILKRDLHGYIVLLMSSTQQVWKEQLRARWRRHHAGSTRRILFLNTLPYAEFLALLSFSDVVLDPFPFGGGVTTLDALALGIPVVTLPSAQTVVQLAAGFLRYMNVADTIVASVAQYVRLATDIANNTNGVRTKLHAVLLANHHNIYDDAASVNDWNAFLAQV